MSDDGYRSFIGEAKLIFDGDSAIVNHIINSCSDDVRNDVLVGSFRSIMTTAHYLSWKNMPYTTDCWKVVRGNWDGSNGR